MAQCLVPTHIFSSIKPIDNHYINWVLYMFYYMTLLLWCH